MMLLTLIENALKHGLAPLARRRRDQRQRSRSRRHARAQRGRYRPRPGRGFRWWHGPGQHPRAPEGDVRRGGWACRCASTSRAASWRKSSCRCRRHEHLGTRRLRDGALAPRRVGGAGVAPNGLAARPSGAGCCILCAACLAPLGGIFFLPVADEDQSSPSRELPQRQLDCSQSSWPSIACWSPTRRSMMAYLRCAPMGLRSSRCRRSSLSCIGISPG